MKHLVVALVALLTPMSAQAFWSQTNTTEAYGTDMLKARGTLNGKETLFLGFTPEDLEPLREHPLEALLVVPRKDVELEFDIVIGIGRTDSDMFEFVSGGINENTKIVIPDGSKN